MDWIYWDGRKGHEIQLKKNHKPVRICEFSYT